VGVNKACFFCQAICLRINASDFYAVRNKIMVEDSSSPIVLSSSISNLGNDECVFVAMIINLHL
jgi:hypothetical protein